MSLWLSFLLIFASSLFLFFKSLNYYFFQDDWFVLNWVQNSDWLSLLNFREDIIYWRPISMPIFFKLGQTVFGINPTGYHLFALIVHFVNTVLVFLLFRRLNLSQNVALFVAFIFATASFHFVPLSWLSTTSYIIGPTFILTSLILFLKNKFILSFIAFILALASSEFAIVIIPIALVLKQSRLVIKPLVPFIIVAFIYLLLRFLVFPLPATGSYEISLAPKVLTNLAWYFAWTFNVPEKISTIFFFLNIKGSIAAALPFLKELIFPLIFIASSLFLIIKAKSDLKKLTIGLIWFVVGIFPVLFLPSHTYSMYVVVGSLGIFYILARALDRLKKYQLQIISVLAIIWFVSSFLTISFNRSNHWIPNQQAISRAYIKEIQKQTQKPPSNTIFLFKPADIRFSRENKFVLVETEDNVKQSLNDQDAVQVIYKDTSLKSIYTTHQKPVSLPSGANVIEISPSVN